MHTFENCANTDLDIDMDADVDEDTNHWCTGWQHKLSKDIVLAS